MISQKQELHNAELSCIMLSEIMEKLDLTHCVWHFWTEGEKKWYKAWCVPWRY
ncbi:protein of unknown function [Ruminococcaceae bacterium BL-6]|nr:protein of unknown function [Ruminococcaceae bacterium BL-6]